MTPLGWARSNVLYDTISEAPKPGSPVESLLILVWQMRQEIEFHALRVLVQGAVDPDQGKSTIEAWGEFGEHFYPYLKNHQKRSDQIALESLYKEIKKGGLKVIPLSPLIKSRLHKKRRDDAPVREATDHDNLPELRLGQGRTWRNRRR